MSILSVAVHAILNGQNPFKVFSAAATQAEAWGENIKKQLPVEVQALIDDQVSVVKQGISAGVQLADKMAGPFLNNAEDGVNSAFVSLVSPYLGPFTGVVTKAEIDMVTSLRDHLIAGIHAEALSLLNQRATAPVPVASAAVAEQPAPLASVAPGVA